MGCVSIKKKNNLFQVYVNEILVWTNYIIRGIFTVWLELMLKIFSSRANIYLKKRKTRLPLEKPRVRDKRKEKIIMCYLIDDFWWNAFYFGCKAKRNRFKFNCYAHICDGEMFPSCSILSSCGLYVFEYKQ